VIGSFTVAWLNEVRRFVWSRISQLVDVQLGSIVMGMNEAI
jgi:hypothetical protein